ncbi:unnamed protein product [Nippostrongylus brasiliensis]|uniref:DnaJ homolog subfamily C member 10 (inferred by orthology to a human protein) n=1 Tax=Nippostrongylus brasiliensis TaxID=27835 RepID=A0A0N4YTB3_NIPBR|nr:unnamed protein product [Nippostrongylus brasiliensis]
MRKKYDQYGEKGLEDGFQAGNNYQSWQFYNENFVLLWWVKRNNNYQSWQFYNENFGIYDDDAEIVTLNRADFQRLVTQSNELWFINFYSTYCSHCHQLAPTWRKFAQAMQGAVRIGAVNCAEDPGLCQSQRVHAYPSLVLYPSGEFYNGVRDMELLQEFVMKRMTSEVLHLKADNIDALTTKWQPYDSRPWVIDFCDETENCLTGVNRRKLAAMLDGLVNVGTLDCKGDESDLCQKLDAWSGVRYYPARGVDKENGKTMDSMDPRELAEEALTYVADLEEIESSELTDLIGGEARDWATAVLFVPNKDSLKEKKDFKRLPTMLLDIKVVYADCSQSTNICQQLLDVRKLPQFVVFKTNGGYEVDYGNKPSYHDASAFIKEAVNSPLHVLTANAYHAALNSGEMWIIDYFAPRQSNSAAAIRPRSDNNGKGRSTSAISAPLCGCATGSRHVSGWDQPPAIRIGTIMKLRWCPPCLRLISEYRRLHSMIDRSDEVLSNLKIGLVDCDKNRAICNKAGVQSYPTSELRTENNKVHKFVGYHSAASLLELIDNTLNPAVDELTPEDFKRLVENRDSDVTWVVDYFAPWCGPCQQLAPELHKAARSLNKFDEKIHFGSVDCQAYDAFCRQQSVSFYPSVRLYPAVSKNRRMQRFYDYPQNMWRNAETIERWVFGMLPSVVISLGNDYWTTVLNSGEPWLVDFFAPWCGHCIQFAPVYEQIAKALDGKVKVGKVDCDAWPGVCRGAQRNSSHSVSDTVSPDTFVRVITSDAGVMTLTGCYADAHARRR